MRGRIAARKMMRDRVDVRRPTGGWTTDAATGDTVPGSTVVHEDVPAWIRVLAQQQRVVESGGQQVTLLAYDVLLPWDVDDIADEDLVVVATSRGTDLEGRTLTVSEVTVGTFQIARRLVCMTQSSAPGGG